jgi:hypothetical protein
MRQDAGQNQSVLTAGVLCLLRILKVSEESSGRPLADATLFIGAIAPIGDVKRK